MCEHADGRDARCELRCVHSQEPKVLELDGHTKETLKVSSIIEFEFISWLDVNEEDVKQSECRSRLCAKELKQWDSAVPGMFASMVPFRVLDAHLIQSDYVEIWSE